MSSTYCQLLGFSVETVYGEDKPTTFKLTNGALFEIFDYGQKKLKKSNTEIWKCIADITSIPIQSLQINSASSHYYRLLKQSKLKRGKAVEEFMTKLFSIPTQTFSSENLSVTAAPAAPTSSVSSASTSVKKEPLHKSKIISTLREENKQLKRKLINRDKLIKKNEDIKTKRQKLESEVKQIVKDSTKASTEVIKQKEKLKTVKSRLSTNLVLANRRIKRMEQQLIGRDNQVTSLKNSLQTLEMENLGLVKQYSDVNQKYNELEVSNDYLQSLVNDAGEIKIYNEDKNIYTNNFVECAMCLTDLMVATRNVSPVIKTVANLCGKKINQLPSRQTVDNIVDRKLAVAQKQIGTVVNTKKDTTIYTDETRKYGHTYQSYILTDELQQPYLLGLREMQNKSAKSCLDTLKEILSDIDKHCEELSKGNNFGPGFEILRNIRNTMSDRASTEKLFNQLLEEYRCSVLPKVIDNYDNLSIDEKNLCGQLNNFFCGLHLLVGIAEVCEASTKRFESDFLDQKLIGSAQQPDLKRFHKSESGTLRLIRTCSKAFAQGEDEKNGVFLPWKTFLKDRKKKNRIIRFRHNRFNVVFVVAEAIFYHRDEIVEFLGTVHGTPNTLLKAVLLDCQENLYKAGVKTFGLISKFISAPLWRLIEEPGHIMDMNRHFSTLVTFLQDTSVEAKIGFLTGQSTPFNTLKDSDDEIMNSLVETNEEIDEIVTLMINELFLGIKELLMRMVPEHLPGGKYWEGDEQLLASTTSALKHNKLPEFIFGQLDHLISFRPNASLLTNEAYLMFAFNKTAKWLNKISDEEKQNYLEESRPEGRKLRAEYKKRIKAIEEERLKVQKKKKEELERLEKERIRKAEAMTSEVCFYGLWQSEEQIDEAIQKLDDEKEVQKALHAQLKFRKTVLHQKHSDSKIFNFSIKQENGKYRKLNNHELRKNLSELVLTAVSGDSKEVYVCDVPLLVGKRISHKFENDITYFGKVINVVPGFPKWYNIKYDEDDAIYSYNLQEDYRKGDLKIIIDGENSC